MGRAQTLTELALKHQWKRGAELGVWQGQTTFYVLSRVPGLFLYAVDHYQAVGSYKDKYMQGAENLYDAKAAWYPGRVYKLRMDTQRAAECVKDQELDFVFVDADHETDSVVADIRAWEPKVKAGGAMCGHDADWPTVRTALEIIGREYQTLPGNVWLYWV
jgi:predicted O-methyltransferase YrrM